MTASRSRSDRRRSASYVRATLETSTGADGCAVINVTPTARLNFPDVGWGGMDLFARILVGADGTDYGTGALRQALLLGHEESAVLAVTALDITPSVSVGWDSSRFASMLREQAERARAEASDILGSRPNATARIVQGNAQTVLRQLIDEFDPTLVALGGRGGSRFLGALLGETASMLLHDLSCSVLLARQQWGVGWHPHRVVVGIDGSDVSLRALEVARGISERLGSALHVVAATGGKSVDRAGAWSEHVNEWDSDSPVVSLTARSKTADLVVVGSRGLHGVRALGSVSERVAHRALCSVLVVHG